MDLAHLLPPHLSGQDWFSLSPGSYPYSYDSSADEGMFVPPVPREEAQLNNPCFEVHANSSALKKSTRNSNSTDVMSQNFPFDRTQVVLEVGESGWKCNLCGENYCMDSSIDKHMELKHNTALGARLNLSGKKGLCSESKPQSVSAPNVPQGLKERTSQTGRTKKTSGQLSEHNKLVSSVPSVPSQASVGSDRSQTRDMNKPATSAATKRNSKSRSVTTSTTVKKASTKPPATRNIVCTSADILICGVCKTQFTSLKSLSRHKKFPCRLKTSCQCMTDPSSYGDVTKSAHNSEKKELGRGEAILHSETVHPLPRQFECGSCDARFNNVWALCQHCQTEHSFNILRAETVEG